MPSDFVEDPEGTIAWVARKNRELDTYLSRLELPPTSPAGTAVNGSERMARPPRTVGEWTYSRRWRHDSVEFVRTNSSDADALTLTLAGDEGAAEILGSEQSLAGDSEYCAVKASDPSPDGAHWAVLVDRAGDEYHALEVRSTDGPLDRPFVTVWTSAGDSCAWSADSRRLYFLDLNERWRPWRVLCWDRASGEVTEVFSEPDEAFDLAFSADATRQRLVVDSQGSEENYVHVVDVTDVVPRVSRFRRQGASRHAVALVGNQVFALHDAANEAGSIELLPLIEGDLGSAPPVREGSASAIYQDLWAVDASTALASVLVDGVHQLHVVDVAGGEDWQVDCIEPLVDVTYVDHLEPGVWSFSSMTYLRGPRFHRLDLARREVTTLGDWLPGATGADHEAERAWVTADDGVEVPLTVLRRADVALGPRTPVLLTAYGCYGGVARPRPRPEWQHCMSAGMVIVFAHIRGGGECGTGWWRAGTRDKRRSIDDLVAVARHLHDSASVAVHGLGIEGHSAGGAIVAAAVNKDPGLFSAVLLDAPFVDVLHDLLDESLPLTVQDWPEWGNPGSSDAAHAYVRSYSPVDNVTAQRYPACLTVATENDIRVPVRHSYAWTAAVEAAVADVGEGGPVLMRIHNIGGHQGAGPVHEQDALMERVRFLLHELAPADGEPVRVAGSLPPIAGTAAGRPR